VLRKAKDLERYKVRAIDGDIGDVDEFYFDDETWTLRYLVVETGSWLGKRRVLIAPESFGRPDWPVRELPVELTQEQVKDSPPIAMDEPVSRQHEIAYRAYFGWPSYWISTPGIGYTGVIVPEQFQRQTVEQPDTAVEEGDPHLRSSRAVTGYHVEARGGDVGHVEDFLIDDETWAIRYIVIDTHNWLPGKHVLLGPEWVQEIDWAASKMRVAVEREQITRAPEFDGSAPIGRDYEEALHAHYGKTPYWTSP
jgi:sporulation protein YlmC with PRC-barrel domain